MQRRNRNITPKEIESVCLLIVWGNFKTELEFHAGTSSYHALHKFGNIGYVEVLDDHLYNRYEYMKAYVPFVTYVWRTWEHIRICC